MAQFDYSYYKDIHRGDADEEAFMKLAPAACDVVDALAGRCISKDASPHVLRALCFQLDLLSKNDIGITRESVGDISVSYSGSGCDRFNGIPISPLAVAALEAGGFTARWT